eukprot:gb/GECH01011064.1/.p1 GENE.gb/GECH01011064.1/~~gb/GECH01011064.1/.p1  ORF type:complete len:497 (+),score=112.72 gb/GECH01011064.1/:1-1491(+)
MIEIVDYHYYLAYLKNVFFAFSFYYFYLISFDVLFDFYYYYYKIMADDIAENIDNYDLTDDQKLEFYSNYHHPEPSDFTEPDDPDFDSDVDFDLPSNEYPGRLNIWDQSAIGLNENRGDEGIASGALEHRDFVEDRANDFRAVAEQPEMYHAISQSSNPFKFFQYHRDRVLNKTLMPEDPYKRYSAFEKANMLSFLFTRPEYHMTLAQKPIYYWDNPANFAQKLPHLNVNEDLLQRHIYRFYAFQSLVLFGVEEAIVRRMKNVIALQQATGECYNDARRRDIPWFSGTVFAGLERFSRFVSKIVSELFFSNIFLPCSPAYHMLAGFTEILMSHPFMVLHTRSLFPYGRRPGPRDLYAGIAPRLFSAWLRGIVTARSNFMPFLSGVVVNSVLSSIDFLCDCISRRQQASEVSKEFEPVSSKDALLERLQHGKKGVVDSLGSGFMLAIMSIGVGTGMTFMQLAGLNTALYPALLTQERGRRHPSSLYKNGNEWETTLL